MYTYMALQNTLEPFQDINFRKFLAALEADKLGRAKDIRPEIQFVLDRKADCSVALQAMRDGVLPLRVTHNDTKLNNVMLDAETRKALCVIDLDTVMPGLVGHDFGDAVRSAASTSTDVSGSHFACC